MWEARKRHTSRVSARGTSETNTAIADSAVLAPGARPVQRAALRRRVVCLGAESRRWYDDDSSKQLRVDLREVGGRRAV